jgi:hypothetical protein
LAISFYANDNSRARAQGRGASQQQERDVRSEGCREEQTEEVEMEAKLLALCGS